MSDHCRGCTATVWGEEYQEHNDFVGWLQSRQSNWRAAWAICEGCGVHLFNNLGEKVCGTPAAPEALRGTDGWGPLDGGCPECNSLAPVYCKPIYEEDEGDEILVQQPREGCKTVVYSGEVLVWDYPTKPDDRT